MCDWEHTAVFAIAGCKEDPSELRTAATYSQAKGIHLLFIVQRVLNCDHTCSCFFCIIGFVCLNSGVCYISWAWQIHDRLAQGLVEYSEDSGAGLEDIEHLTSSQHQYIQDLSLMTPDSQIANQQGTSNSRNMVWDAQLLSNSSDMNVLAAETGNTLGSPSPSQSLS